MSKMRFTHPALEYSDYNHGRNFVMVEGKMEVCPSCGGHGRHVRHDLDDSAMVDSMREDGDDEGLAAYFGGAFDEICRTCGGANVVMVPNWDALPEWARKDIEDWDRSFSQRLKKRTP